MHYGRLTIAAILIAAPLTLAACGSGEQSYELTFRSQFIDRQVEVTGSEGSTMASTVAGHGALLDEAGARIGDFNVTSTVTRTSKGSENRIVNAEYGFGSPDDTPDEILIMGSEEFDTPTGLPFLMRDLNYAVVGGVGKYAGARGTCLVHRTKKNEFTTTCNFTVAPA